MRFTLVMLLLLAAMSPMLGNGLVLDETVAPSFTTSNGVEVIDEIEPNNANTTGQDVYPGDVVRGSVDMWNDAHDWYNVWLEPGQTLLLTLSHASGDGVSMSVWDEENTNHGTSNPSKTRDTLFLDETASEVGGQYSVSINATMTEAGGGAYVLEIDAGYTVDWYAPEAGWFVSSEQYDAKGNLMYTSSLSSYQFAESASTTVQSAPVWTTGDFWNTSVSMPSVIGTYDEYHQMTVTGSDTVDGIDCYRVSLEGKSTLTISIFGMETKHIDEESGVACFAKSTLALVHENVTMTSSTETSGGIGAMSSDETAGRSCTDEFGDPDADCDGVTDDWDDCPGTAAGADVDAWGCSDAQNSGGGGGGDADTDGDGVPDSSDACPNDPADPQNDADGDGCSDSSGGGGDGGGGDGTADADGDGVSDAEDSCPDTASGATVDVFGCSDAQNGGSGGGGSGGSGGGDGGFGGGMGGGCTPSPTDMSQKTVIRSDLVYADGGLDAFKFPLSEGTVWSEATVGSGTMSLSVEMGGCPIMSIDLEGSDALPLNHRHLGTQDFTVDSTTLTANGIQTFAGREGNNDWATPDFTLLPSVVDDVARMGLPFAAWITTVGFNEFDANVNLSATVNADNAPVTFSTPTLGLDELGAVVVDTMNMSSGEYTLTITGTHDGRERAVTVPFTVDNDPDFAIATMDPWIMVPGGVPWVVPTPIFVEPVNGFGADVSLSVVVPEGLGITGELDFARGSAPFMAVLTLTLPDNLTVGDYTVVVSGTSGETVRSDEITFTVTEIPEFSVELDNREQELIDGDLSIGGAIDAHNGLDLALGGVVDIIIEPYNEALLESAVITWGAIDANGDLTFDVVFTVDETIPRHNYTVQLNVVSLDGGIAHSASVVFVTESSTLDGTAEAADDSAVVSGNTEEHDGEDTAAGDVGSGADDSNGDGNDGGNGDDNAGDNGDGEGGSSDGQSSNTALIVGSSLGVLILAAAVAFLVMRGRGDAGGKDFLQPNLAAPGMQAGMVQQPAMGMQPMVQQQTMAQPMMQQPQQAMPQAAVQPQPAVQQPMVQPAAPAAVQPQPAVQPQQVAHAPAPPTQMQTAPPPPAQPTTVPDYTGLQPGGTYDQSTGQTIYVQPDGTRWQMMPDGSFTRLG